MLNPADILNARILVVDDNKADVALLKGMLQVAGYTSVESTTDPKAVCALHSKNRYGLILLDLQMPAMDGFQVMEELKVIEEDDYLPVLVVAAQPDHKLRALRAGAKDFVSKPFDLAEMVARVHNILEVRLLHLETKKYGKMLEETVRMLETSHRRLQEMERMRDNLVDMVVHDLRQPLTGLEGYLGLLDMTVKGRLTEKEHEYLGIARHMTWRLVEMVSSILDVSRLEGGQMPLNILDCDLLSVSQEAVQPLLPVVKVKHLRLALDSEGVTCGCDRAVIGRVIGNLVGNAVKFTPEGGDIRVSFAQNDAQTKVTVSDSGCGIPPEYREVVFDKFTQVDSGPGTMRYSTGLGLAYCKLAVERHGGSIGLDSTADKGSTFWFTLPKTQPAHRV